MDRDRRVMVLLLANLDYNIGKLEILRIARNKKVLLPRLQNQLKNADVPRSQKKIDLLLHKLWKDYKSQNYQGSYEKIYSSGTNCLKNLDPDLRRSVQLEVTVIRDHEELLRSNTPRTLRSGSQKIEGHPRLAKRESGDPFDIASIDSPLTGKYGSRLQQESGSLGTVPQANQVRMSSRREL